MQLSQSAPQVLPVTYEEYKTMQANRKTGSDSMDQQDFLNLLVTQLQNQDPLDPMDNSDFTSQTTAFSQLEQQIAMAKSLETLITLQQNSQGTSGSLMNSASFIGKVIEFDTNTLTVSSDGSTPISFVSTDNANGAEVRIYNSEGALVGIHNINEPIKRGNNAFNWDGVCSGGVVLQEGSYSYEIIARNDAGEQIEIGTYGEGTVIGVTISGGKTYFKLDNGLVPADSVYSVKEKSSGGTEG